MLFKLGISVVDDFTRVSTRSFLLEAVAFANAQTLVGTFVPAYQAVTECHVFESRLTEVDTIAGSPVAGANVDAGMSISAQLDTPGKKANIQIPNPVAAVVNADGSIDLTDVLITTLETEYTKATPYVTASDGEKVTSFLKGTLDR